jgi:signal transduction histidine kinase
MSNDTARQKSITISTELTDNAIVFADIDMIKVLLRNLISNAIKFTNPGGEIVVSVEQEQKNWKISVKDNGVGIKKDAIDRLFRIDSNYKTSGTNDEKGTGLGLLLCKEFVEKHRGKIWVESEIAKGSIFSFTIPFTTALPL